MDPEACLERLMNALADADLDEARAALADYRGWRQGGGFEPEFGDIRAEKCAKLLNHLIDLKRRTGVQPANVASGGMRSAFDVEVAYGALLLASSKMDPHERRIAAIRLGHDAQEHGEDTAEGKLAIAIADLFDPVDDEEG